MTKLLLSFFILFSIPFLSFGQKESLKIHWPEEYNWKIGSNQEDESVHMLELIPEKETLHKWSIMGNMLSIKGVKDVPMDVVMNMMYQQAKENAPKAILTLIEKNEEGDNHWVLFKLEAPNFKNDKKPESQLYYVVQGEQALYTNFVAIKNKNISDDFVKKWTEIFKKSEFVHL